MISLRYIQFVTMSTAAGDISDEEVARPSFSDRRRARDALAAVASTSCPYLATVNRRALDFDRAKVCSVTLSPQHVYSCLVCGLFFAGRGRGTPAADHAAAAGHFVWVGLSPPDALDVSSWAPRFWCLPDGYEIIDASLDDVAAALRPRFPAAALATIDSDAALAADAQGTPFLPGYVGLNNLGHTDGVGSVALLLAHVAPLRDYFLTDPPAWTGKTPLVDAFGNFVRRVWARVALRSTVSPVVLINAVSEASARRYSAGTPVDAAEFLAWLLNALHKGLTSGTAGVGSGVGGGGVGDILSQKRPRHNPLTAAATAAILSPPPSFAGCTSIISDTFCGLVQVTILSSDLENEKAAELALVKATAATARRKARADMGMASGGGGGGEMDEEEEEEGGGAKLGVTTTNDGGKVGKVPISTLPRVLVHPFLFLSLELPPAPLFSDASGITAIPHVPAYSLFERFGGVVVSDSLQGQYRERRRYQLLRAPAFLTLSFKRFSRNAYVAEKNSTIVTFPTRNFELRPYIAPAARAAARRNSSSGGGGGGGGGGGVTAVSLPSIESIATLSVAELKRVCVQAGSPLLAHDVIGMERQELIARTVAVVVAAATAAAAAVVPPPPPPSSSSTWAAITKYDLVGSVVQDVVAKTAAGAGGTGAGGLAGGGGGAKAGGFSVGGGGGGNLSLGGIGSASVTGATNGDSGAAIRAAVSDADPLLRGSYRVHLLGPSSGSVGEGSSTVTAATGSWLEIADERVGDVMAQQVGVSEACILIFARRNTREALADALREVDEEADAAGS